MKKATVDVFERDIYFFNSHDDLIKYCNKNHYEAEELEEYAQFCSGLSGFLIPTETNKSDNCPFFLLTDTDDISVIVHEAVHASMFMLDQHGVPFDVDNQEMLAYLTAYIFKMYCKQYKLVPNGQLTHQEK